MICLQCPFSDSIEPLQRISGHHLPLAVLEFHKRAVGPAADQDQAAAARQGAALFVVSPCVLVDGHAVTLKTRQGIQGAL